MSLRTQILGTTEKLSDLVWSAEQRFREGEELLRDGHFSGAVYLLGLSSEMWLKAAVFRHLGHNPATAILGLFGPVRTWMRVSAPAIDPESFHSLRYWGEYLIRIRTQRRQLLPSALEGELRHHVIGRLYEDWKIDLRYRAIPVSERHAVRVYNDAAWLRKSWNYLWR
jgi:hypothetical protein